jgi:hypothetical protein
MEAYKDFIEVVLKHLTDRIALAALFVCIILKAVSMFWANIWLQQHSMWIGIGILFPLCYLPTRPIIDKYNEWEAAGKAARKRDGDIKAREERLKRLSKQEKRLLSSFLTNDSSSNDVSFHDWPVALGLERDGVVYVSGDEHPSIRSKPYNIDSQTFERLKKNPDFLK